MHPPTSSSSSLVLFIHLLLELLSFPETFEALSETRGLSLVVRVSLLAAASLSPSTLQLKMASPSTSIKAVVFDFGGVLLSNKSGYDYWAREFLFAPFKLSGLGVEYEQEPVTFVKALKTVAQRGYGAAGGLMVVR